jgi:hypothetical protein
MIMREDNLLMGYAVESGAVPVLVPIEYSQEAVHAIRQHGHDLVRAISFVESMESLSLRFLSIEATAATAKQYEVAVGALIQSAGIAHLPISLIAPSFESASDYSTEAEDKQKSFLAKIWEWIKQAAAKFMEGLRKLLGMRIHHAAKVADDLRAIKEIIPTLSDKKVRAFSMAAPGYGFTASGKFAIKMSDIHEAVRHIQDTTRKLSKIQEDVIRLDPATLEGVTSSEDIYHEIGFNRVTEMPFIEDSKAVFDPKQHFALSVKRHNRTHQVTETAPMEIKDLVEAVNALEAFSFEQKTINDSIQATIGRFTGMSQRYQQILDKATKTEGDTLDKILRETDREYGWSLGSADLANLRGEHLSANEQQRKDDWKAARNVALATYKKRISKYAGYKYVINAFMKMSMGYNEIAQECDNFQRCGVRILRTNVECYTIFKKAEKKEEKK